MSRIRSEKQASLIRAGVRAARADYHLFFFDIVPREGWTRLLWDIIAYVGYQDNRLARKAHERTDFKLRMGREK